MSTTANPVSADSLKPVLIGRSSSSFTRIVRVCAVELQVDYSLQVVRDLMSQEPADYGGNPALKLPVLRTSHGVWFGALNSCRELARIAVRKPKMLWPEDLQQALLANAQELIAHALSTAVTLVMSKLASDAEETAHQQKMRLSLTNALTWLDDNLASVLDALPADRDISYAEISLFCLITHLEFRKVLPMHSYTELARFAAHFAARPAAQSTAYRFDT